MTASLFLSHSGSDKAAAIDLKRRLLASPDAQAAGLKVWLDVDDLDAGKPWQPQVEAAIGAASAFAVMVDSHGILKWVHAETEVALSRAIKDESFRFIPILQDGGSEKLTPFVKRYQAIRDPLNDPDALQRLLRAALCLDKDGLPVLIDDPFPGLRSMSEDWADRFFGRRSETDEVLALLRRHRAVTIVADSGAGKSSLAMAGVGHAWRGGALRTDRPRTDDQTIWHVVTMRPADNPIDRMRDAIQSAAGPLGRDQAAIASLRQSLTTDPSFALLCGLDPASTHTLLIIDQAEELVTLTPRERRPEFGRLIAALADAMGDRLRILITLRSDHLNLVGAVEGLGPMIRPPEAQFNLKQPADLAEIVRGPLTLAGHREEAEQQKLIDRLRKDLSNRPGDLALAQMTLSLAWRDREKHGGLLGAYAVNGGVLVALGREAERVERTLPPEDAARLMPIFIRLIRLSEIDTGATRRIAAREEFDAVQNRLINRLAGERLGKDEDDLGRLVQTSAAHVEIAHEALITQWPRLHEYLIEHAGALRTLSDLMRRAQDWAAAEESATHLTSLADEERFQALQQAQGAWLAPVERRFLDWSRAEHQRIRDEREKTARRIRSGVYALAALLLVLLGVAWFAFDRDLSARIAEAEAREQAEVASVEAERAALFRVDALALLALTRAETDPMEALKLAMSAWPSDETGPSPSFHVISEAIRRSLQIAPRTSSFRVWSENFSGNINDIAIHRELRSALISATEGVFLLHLHTRERTELLSSLLGPASITSLAVSERMPASVFLGGRHGTVEIRELADTEGRNAEIIRTNGEATHILSSRSSERVFFSTPTAVWLIETDGEMRMLGEVSSERSSRHLISSLSELSNLDSLIVGTISGDLFLADTRKTQTDLSLVHQFTGPVLSIDYHEATSQIAIGSNDGRVEIFRIIGDPDMDRGFEIETAGSIQLPSSIFMNNSVNFVRFNHDGSWVYAGDTYGVFRIIDARFGVEIYRIVNTPRTSVDLLDSNSLLNTGPRVSGFHVAESHLDQQAVRLNIWLATSSDAFSMSDISFWQLSLPQGNLLQIACMLVHSQVVSNGDRGLDTSDLATEIGIDGLTLPEDCDTYDPPLPPEFRR